MRDVAITGLGAVSSLGDGCQALERGLREGRDGIRPVRRFDLTGYSTDLAGVVPNANEPGMPNYELCIEFAVRAIREAVTAAGVSDADMCSPRSALFLGLSPIGGDSLVHELATAIRDELGWTCAALTISTACCSSTAAIGAAGAFMEQGAFDRIVAGGAEAIVPGLFAGFHALGALTTERCSPFSTTTGTTLGEGAGFVVLERSPRAPIAWISGFGLSNDAWHETSPDPSGAGIALSLTAALVDAGARASDIEYVNAHGTGTAANDIAETLALQTVLGAKLPPVSSTKGHLGHAQAAAGSLELIATLLCRRDVTLPPTLRARPKRARMPDDCVETEAPRAGSWRRFAKNSAAFGGANATLVVADEPGARAETRPLWIGGVSAVGRHGAGVTSLKAAWAGAEMPIEPPRPRIKRVSTDGMEPASVFATAAVVDALRDAGVRAGRGSTDTVGVVGGLVCASPSEKQRLDDGIEARGMINLPVSAFARLVLNTPPSTAARALGLRGPHTAVSTGGGSGLAAVVLSATLLSRDPRTDAIVAVGVHEPPQAEAHRGFGAAAAVLQAHPACVRLAGWAMGNDRSQVEAQALDKAELDDVELRYGPETARTLGLAPGLDDLQHVALAVDAMRERQVRTALITGVGTATTAIVLVRED